MRFKNGYRLSSVAQQLLLPVAVAAEVVAVVAVVVGCRQPHVPS
jgi:hypothetical protein